MSEGRGGKMDGGIVKVGTAKVRAEEGLYWGDSLVLALPK